MNKQEEINESNKQSIDQKKRMKRKQRGGAARNRDQRLTQTSPWWAFKDSQGDPCDRIRRPEQPPVLQPNYVAFMRKLRDPGLDNAYC